MSILNGRGIAPIDTEEFASFLGEPIDAGSVCTSKKINKWSRKKPMFIGSGKPDSPAYTDDIWRTYNFGLVPPERSRIGGAGSIASLAQILKDDPEWNSEEWGFNPGGMDFYRLTDFDGYFHYVGAPFDVPGLLQETYNSGESSVANKSIIVFDIDIPVNGQTGGISMFELPQFSQSLDLGYHLCLMFKQLTGSNAGEIYVFEDPNTIASYRSQSGIMASIRMQISAEDLKNVNERTEDQFPDYEWWLCASTHSPATDAEWHKGGLCQPVDLGDATTWFMSLPTSRPETCHGIIRYEGKHTATEIVKLRFDYWGIENVDYWYPSLGLRPASTTVQFGEMLMDHNYGLQIGVTITNISDVDVNFQFQPKSIRVSLSRTFESQLPKSINSPTIYLSDSKETNTSLDNKTTSLGSGNSVLLNIPKGGSLNLILDLGWDAMSSMGSSTPTGQSFRFEVTTLIQTAYGHWSSDAQGFNGRN